MNIVSQSCCNNKLYLKTPPQHDLIERLSRRDHQIYIVYRFVQFAGLIITLKLSNLR